MVSRRVYAPGGMDTPFEPAISQAVAEHAGYSLAAAVSDSKVMEVQSFAPTVYLHVLN